MKTTICLFVFTTICLFLITFLSCGSDTEVEPGPVKFISARPKNGSTLDPDGSITVYFTATPENLTVEPGTVDGNKSRVTITGPFPLGDSITNRTYALPGRCGFLTAPNSVKIREIWSYCVSPDQYKQFVEATGHQEPERKEIAPYAPTDQHPIVTVSWYDAMAFAKWTRKRLHTEAEWEKAARGGSVAKTYPWGNLTPKGKQCNFADKNLTHYWWADKKADDGYTFTAPVGSYP